MPSQVTFSNSTGRFYSTCDTNRWCHLDDPRGGTIARRIPRIPRDPRPRGKNPHRRAHDPPKSPRRVKPQRPRSVQKPPRN